MNKAIAILSCLLLIGCNSTKQQSIETTETYDLKQIGQFYYQAYDHKWRTDPTINPAFDTKSEAYEYANEYNKENAHLYIVRMINYRFEIRNVNSTENELIYTSNDYNDAFDFVDEYKAEFKDLVLYDLKTGKSYEGDL
jgi:hypothetical protein